MDDKLQYLTFHEVDRERLKDLVALFEGRGGPKYCWCMVWRTTPEERKRRDPLSRKTAFVSRVMDGIPVGILGYIDDKPIAWCSIAPRNTYRHLGVNADEPNENVWSIVCFFVMRQYRNQGMMTRLISAAIEQAKKRGATVVEAYPVDSDAPSYRFMGFVPVFEKAGFTEVGASRNKKARNAARAQINKVVLLRYISQLIVAKLQYKAIN